MRLIAIETTMRLIARDNDASNCDSDNDASRVLVLYTNAQSLVKKIDELRVIGSINSPDIIVITEAWTNESISDEYLSIKGYDIIDRKDRNDTDKGRGGGIVVYVKKGIHAWKEEAGTAFNQCSAIRIKSKRGEIQIYVVYRSPNSVKTNDDELCEWVAKMRGTYVILGDFNFPDIRWLAGCAGTKGRRFLETAKDNFLTQHVLTETHNSGNTLDLILSNKDETVSEVQMIGKLGKSDHHILTCKVQIGIERSNDAKKFRDFNKANEEEMRRFMKRDWESEMTGLNVEETWSLLRQALEAVIQSYVPLRKRKPNDEPKWMDKAVRMVIQEKKMAWKEWKRTGRECDRQLYKKAETKSKKTIRNKKNALERDIARKRKTEPKLYYAYINSAKRSKSRIGPLKNDTGEFVIDPKEQAEMFSDFFKTVFTKSTGETPKKEKVANSGSLVDVEITAEQIVNLIDGMREFSAPGPDGFPPKLFKMLVREIAEPLKILFRRSLDEGKIPDDWRDAHVTPIFKKGSKAVPGNYRPVSLTCGIGKLLEKIVKRAIDEHVEKNDLMSNSQHGFRSGRSPQTNLLEFFNQTTKWHDDGKCFDVIYLDFSKAFDVICHKSLVVKLEAIGIEGKVIRWIVDWLKDRRQRVRVDGEFSDWVAVESSVLQGSVLGGILFNIFIDDIDMVVFLALLKKFADDTKIAAIVESMQDARRMQENLNRLCEWAKKWRMIFNTAKCKVIHYGKRNERNEYWMNGLKIASEAEEKDLGVWVTDTMKPTKQCLMAANSANWALGQLSRSFHYRKAECLIPLYKTFVRPKLEHAVAAWSPWAAGDREVLENVQRRMVRMLSNKRGRTYEERLESVGLTTLTERRARGDMIEVFRTMKGFNRVDKNDWFHLRDPATSRATRSTVSVSNDVPEQRKDVLFKECVRLDTRKHFFTVRVIQEWNDLPDCVRNQKTINSFKNHYDELKRRQRTNTNS